MGGFALSCWTINFQTNENIVLGNLTFNCSISLKPEYTGFMCMCECVYSCDIHGKTLGKWKPLREFWEEYLFISLLLWFLLLCVFHHSIQSHRAQHHLEQTAELLDNSMCQFKINQVYVLPCSLPFFYHFSWAKV